MNGTDNELDFGTDEPQVELNETTTEQLVRTPAADEPTDQTDEVGDEELVDDTADQTGTEAGTEVELTDEQKEAAAKAEAEKAEADFNEAVAAFETTVETVVQSEDRDQSTGTLPEVLKAKVIEAYGNLPGAKGKAAGKKYLSDKMAEMMVSGVENPENFLLARTYLDLQNEVTKAKAPAGSGVARPKVDPTEAFRDRIAAMLLAPSLVTVPEDVKEGWDEAASKLATSLEEDVRKYQAWVADTSDDKPDTVEVSPVVLAAAKIAAGRPAAARRASSGTSTPRSSSTGATHAPGGDIKKHLEEVFANVESGTFLTIAEMSKAITEAYPDPAARPSQGAIAVRLFPKTGTTNLDFVKPEGKEHNRPVKGAVKI
jgi:hypothetical protein